MFNPVPTPGGRARRLRAALALALLALAPVGLVGPARAAFGDPPFGAVIVTHEVRIDAEPAAVWKAMTGDISGWWDHSFSSPDQPARLFIEPVPGGGFWEYFGDSPAEGGVLHAQVNMVRPEKTLIMTGPLGFAGSAVALVSTIELEADGAGTIVKVKVEMAGHVEEAWGDALDGVWRHFIEGRLKPYVEAGCQENPECGVFDRAGTP